MGCVGSVVNPLGYLKKAALITIHLPSLSVNNWELTFHLLAFVYTNLSPSVWLVCFCLQLLFFTFALVWIVKLWTCSFIILVPQKVQLIKKKSLKDLMTVQPCFTSPPKTGREKLWEWCLRWPHMPNKQERIAVHCTCSHTVPIALWVARHFGWWMWMWAKQWSEGGKIKLLMAQLRPFWYYAVRPLGSCTIRGSLQAVSSPWNIIRLLSVSKANYLKWWWTSTCRQVGFPQSVVLNLKIIFLS